MIDSIVVHLIAGISKIQRNGGGITTLHPGNWFMIPKPGTAGQLTTQEPRSGWRWSFFHRASVLSRRWRNWRMGLWRFR